MPYVRKDPESFKPDKRRPYCLADHLISLGRLPAYPDRWVVVGTDRCGDDYRFPIQAEAQMSRREAHALAIRMRQTGASVLVLHERFVDGAYRPGGRWEEADYEVAGVERPRWGSK